jgi:chromosome segregation ATPase
MSKPAPNNKDTSSVTDTALDSYAARVVELMSNDRRRGRPPTGTAKSNAERQRLYRERQKAKVASAPAIPARDAEGEARGEELNRKLADALEEVARLNKENDALAYKVDRLTRDLKAGENENTRLRKRQDELVADLEHLRSRVARWKAQDGSETTEEPIRPKGRKGQRKA